MHHTVIPILLLGSAWLEASHTRGLCVFCVVSNLDLEERLFFLLCETREELGYLLLTAITNFIMGQHAQSLLGRPLFAACV